MSFRQPAILSVSNREPRATQDVLPVRRVHLCGSNPAAPIWAKPAAWRSIPAGSGGASPRAWRALDVVALGGPSTTALIETL
jgi:hypothetical protein